MRIKKMLTLLVAFLATTAFASCGGDDGDGGGSNGSGTTVTEVKVTPTSLSFTKDGGTQTVSVQSVARASASTDQSWCTAVAGTQSSSLKVTPITVTVEANTTTSVRQAVITVSADGKTLTVSVTQQAGEATPEPVPDPTGDITKTAREIAKAMSPGWNLGNTMEGGNNANNWTNNGGLGGETAWQSTKTSQAVIDFIKQQGFKSVRIPAAWVMGHITDKDNVTIDAAWMARVKEVVNYCINDGLYVLLNDHWDGGWLENSFSDISDATVQANSEKLRKLWTQIANAFRDYDEHLVFGGLNEPACDNQAKTDALLKYEQVFIDAVRATGGNNAKRTLVVQGPSTDIDNTNKYYDVTKLTDTASGLLMVEVHYYNPWTFCGLEEDASWGKMAYYWGSSEVSGSNRNGGNGPSYLKAQFQKMKTKFVDKGYPVVIGEYGCQWRNVGTSENQDKHNASVREFHKEVNLQAGNMGMVPMVWGTNYCNQNGTRGSMTVINRASLSVWNQHAMDGITEGVAAATWPY